MGANPATATQSTKKEGEEMRKTVEEIYLAMDHKKLNKGIDEGSQYAGMSYEEGIMEALRWVLGDTDNDEFEYAGG